MPHPVIRTEGLHYTYMAGTPWERTALRGIDLSIPKGAIAAVIGPTGSGKTTLALHFNGLLKPSRGRVFVGETDLSAPGLDLRSIRKKVGMVFQFPEHQVFEETVFDEVAFGLRNFGYPEREVPGRVREAMEGLDLSYETLKDRLPLSLSGGELRRVALAGVLAMKPEVLVMDEPTAGLDPHNRKRLLEKLRCLSREEETTVVLISHGLEEIASLADLVFILEEGRILLSGAPREIFADDSLLRHHHLDIPEFTRLLLLLREKGFPAATGCLTLEETRDEILRLWNS